MSRLHHPHIVEVFDVGESGDTAYYVMELLVGEDLRARMRREGTLAWDMVRTIARQICDALDAAHRGGVVHRDLKPENCFLVHLSDNSVLLKLLDFGVAKVTVDSDADRLTGTGETLGTVGYMAPEQLEGVAHPCVDVYALGVMLYEMLSGRPPHPGNPAQVIARLARGTPPVSLAEVCADLPVEFVALVERAMTHDPQGRYPDMHEFARALDSLPKEALRGRAGRDSRVQSGRLHWPATTGVDAHAPTASPPGARGVVVPPGASPREQQLGQDFRTLVVITVLAALVVVGSTLWLVRPPSRVPATLQGELQQALARCRPIRASGLLEISVLSTANGELGFALVNPHALQVADAACVERVLDELRTSVGPADLGTTPLSIQIDPAALREGG